MKKNRQERGNRLLRLLDYWAGIPLCFLSAIFRKTRKAIFPVNPRRLCILCQGAIGDALLLSALIQALHRKFPACRIDLLLSPGNGQAGELIPNIHSIRVFPVTKVLALIAHLRREKYDLLIDSTQWARIGALISNCSGAAFTAGFQTSGQMRHFGYDKKVWHSSERHEKDNFLALGKAIWEDLDGECVLNIPERKKLEGEFSGQKWICMHMWPSGVRSWLKEWPEENWRQLCEELLQAGYQILLTGGKEDREKSEDFLHRYFKNEKRILSLAGKYKLGEIACILKQARALISVNTGIMHLGALAAVPTIALHGPTNPLRWGPLGEKHINLLPCAGRRAYLDLGFEYPPDARNNMGQISVKDVLDGLKKLGIEDIQAWNAASSHAGCQEIQKFSP